MILLRFVVLGSALLALGSACGRSDSASTDGGPRFPNPHWVPGTPDDDDGDGDDDDDDNPVETPVETPSETPTPEPTATPIEDGDEDGDGIPDGDDNLPCIAIKLTLTNDGVSSAQLSLNAVEVVGTSDFPTTMVIERYVNPVNGANEVTVDGKLAGSPSDSLHLVIAAADGSATYLDQTVSRNPGAPSAVAVSFVVNATCP